MKAQGVSRDTIPWKSPFQPYTAWVGFVGSTIITLVAGFPVFLKGNWSTSNFFASYVGIPIFIVPIILWKVFKRTKVSTWTSPFLSRGLLTDDPSLFGSPTWICGPAGCRKEKSSSRRGVPRRG